MRLENKVCIITGAGGGMGKEAAKRFAKEGAKVAVFERDSTAGKETVDEIIQDVLNNFINGFFACCAISFKDCDLCTFFSKSFCSFFTHATTGTCDDTNFIF